LIGIGALLLAAVGFVALGRWQLERAAFNRAIADGYERADTLPVLERPVSAQEAGNLRYRRIALRGRFEAGTQILLDNMTYQGRAGYQVLTPLRLSTGAVALVNRGWVAASPDRRELPDVALADMAAVVSGRVDRLPRAALEFDSAAPGAAAPLVVLSFPDYDDIEAVLGEAVLPFLVLLDPGADFGFVRDWAPSTGRADRNIAYAVQWFGLATLAFGLALGTVVRDYRRRPRRERA